MKNARRARGFERVVYLGSHIFKGLAREAALKLLELTDGGMIAAHDLPMGFRHGPKTIVNERTLVVIFLSNHAYTRRYDLDLLRRSSATARPAACSQLRGRTEEPPPASSKSWSPPWWTQTTSTSCIPFIAAPQIFAFEQAIARGLSPDNPNISGTVNRVVQGVRIHALRYDEPELFLGVDGGGTRTQLRAGRWRGQPGRFARGADLLSSRDRH